MSLPRYLLLWTQAGADLVTDSQMEEMWSHACNLRFSPGVSDGGGGGGHDAEVRKKAKGHRY